MGTFAQEIVSWHDFYIMVGTASATLIGLLFVSLSINVDMITRKENVNLRTLAAQTFSIFITVLMIAIQFLIPSQTPLGLGLPLLAIGGLGSYNTIHQLIKTRHMWPRAWGRRIAVRFGLPITCFMALIIIATL